MDGAPPTRRWTAEPCGPSGRAVILRDGVPVLITAAAAGDTEDEHLLFGGLIAEALERGPPDPLAAAAGAPAGLAAMLADAVTGMAQAARELDAAIAALDRGRR